MSYAPWFAAWHDFPATDTPVTAAALEHIEAGIVAADAANGLNAAAIAVLQGQVSLLLNVTPTPTLLTIGLSTDQTSGVVLTSPAGAANINWARTSTQTSNDADYEVLSTSASFAGTSAKPWVDAEALDADGNPIGAFVGRIDTVQTAPPPPSATVRFGITNNVNGNPSGNGPPVLAIGAKLIREDSTVPAWAKSNGVDVIQIVYPGDTPDPAAYAYEVVGTGNNEPYWADVNPATYFAALLSEVNRVKALNLGKPIIIPLVAYGSTAGNNGMDGISYPGQYAYPQPPSPYMANAAPWVTLANTNAPTLLGLADGFAVHPYFNNPAFNVLDTVRASLTALGHTQPFWITECGMYSSSDNSGDAAQNTVIAAQITAANARTDLACYVLYRLGQAIEGSAYWGILRADGSQRPAYATYKAAIAASP